MRKAAKRLVSCLKMSETSLPTSQQRFRESERMQERVDKAQEQRDRIDAILGVAKAEADCKQTTKADLAQAPHMKCYF